MNYRNYYVNLQLHSNEQKNNLPINIRCKTSNVTRQTYDIWTANKECQLCTNTDKSSVWRPPEVWGLPRIHIILHIFIYIKTYPRTGGAYLSRGGFVPNELLRDFIKRLRYGYYPLYYCIASEETQHTHECYYRLNVCVFVCVYVCISVDECHFTLLSFPILNADTHMRAVASCLWIKRRIRLFWFFAVECIFFKFSIQKCVAWIQNAESG